MGDTVLQKPKPPMRKKIQSKPAARAATTEGILRQSTDGANREPFSGKK